MPTIILSSMHPPFRPRGNQKKKQRTKRITPNKQNNDNNNCGSIVSNSLQINFLNWIIWIFPRNSSETWNAAAEQRYLLRSAFQSSFRTIQSAEVWNRSIPPIQTNSLLPQSRNGVNKSSHKSGLISNRKVLYFTSSTELNLTYYYYYYCSWPFYWLFVS